MPWPPDQSSLHTPPKTSARFTKCLVSAVGFGVLVLPDQQVGCLVRKLLRKVPQGTNNATHPRASYGSAIGETYDEESEEAADGTRGRGRACPRHLFCGNQRECHHYHRFGGRCSNRRGLL